MSDSDNDADSEIAEMVESGGRFTENIDEVFYIQCLPKVSEHPREPNGKRSFSRRSHKSSFRRKATNFRLELVM